MNILIPLAGLGKRFSDEGFTEPKPLIKIENKEMILHAIDSLGINGRYLFVIRKSDFSEDLKNLLASHSENSVILENFVFEDNCNRPREDTGYCKIDDKEAELLHPRVKRKRTTGEHKRGRKQIRKRKTESIRSHENNL